MKSIAAALLVIQGIDPSALHARADELEATVREEGAAYQSRLRESILESKRRLQLAMEEDYACYKDIRDYEYFIKREEGILLEDPAPYAQHWLDLVDAREALDEWYAAAEAVQHHVGSHVGTAKGTLRQSGRRRGMGCLWESPKWDGHPRQHGHQSWKNYRGQQYRPADGNVAA